MGLAFVGDGIPEAPAVVGVVVCGGSAPRFEVDWQVGPVESVGHGGVIFGSPCEGMCSDRRGETGGALGDCLRRAHAGDPGGVCDGGEPGGVCDGGDPGGVCDGGDPGGVRDGGGGDVLVGGLWLWSSSLSCP